MYRGKYFSVLGDSISTLGGYSEPGDAVYYDSVRKLKAKVFAPEDTWWGKVIDHLGGTLLVNHSVSGSLATKHPECMIPSHGCSDERTSALGRGGIAPDVILILLGVNDWGWQVKLAPEVGEENDPSVFSVAYDSMLKKLRSNYPLAELWCFTLPVSADQAIRYRGASVEDYNNVIRSCAKAQGARVLELYRPDACYHTVDGFHPNATGMQQMAELAIEQI